jgi:hypothetical protein
MSSRTAVGTLTATLPPLPRLCAVVLDDAETPGAYATDGERLLRLLGSGEPRYGWCAVEDCATLEVTLVHSRELLGWGLRPLRRHGAVIAA